MKKLLVAGLAIIWSLGISGNAVADTVIYNYTVAMQEGVPFPVSMIPEFQPVGFEMSGMVVTVLFEDNKEKNYIWPDLQGDLVGVSDSTSGFGWSLSLPGDLDTYYDGWTLASTSATIKKIVIDAVRGYTVSDTSHLLGTYVDGYNKTVTYPIQGTNGSMQGWTFSETGSSPYPNTYTVTYSGAIYLKGENWADSPVGDLYRYLTIDFGTTSFNAGSKLTFRADTDKMTPVPEPTTLLLFATGLAGLAAVGRHRRN